MKNFYSKILISFLVVATVLGGGLDASAVSTATLSVKQGEVLLYPVKNTETDLTAYLGTEKMPIFEHGGKRYALVAADVNKKTGNYNLQIKSGAKILEKKTIRVRLGSYPKVLRKVAYKFGTLPKAEQEAAAKDKAPLVSFLVEAVKTPSPKLWQSNFINPLGEMKTTSPFGYKRIYTNHSTTHNGVDLRAIVGTPVYATSDGKVLWGEQKSLYLEGPTVVIDHGDGIVSKYLHLSQVLVQTGSMVKAGDIIGYSGAEGADVSGAHLHFAIKVRNASVSPLQFIKEFQKLQPR